MNNLEVGTKTRKALNDLARHELICKLLKDIAFDMTVCRLEGWDALELPKIIQGEMERILNDRKRKN